MEDIGGCSQGEICVNDTLSMQRMWDNEANPINAPDGAHKLTSVKKASEEAKRHLQSNCDSLKGRQEKVGHEMKKYKELLRQLEAEYKDTMEDMRRHQEEQVSDSCLALYRRVSAATIV